MLFIYYSSKSANNRMDRKCDEVLSFRCGRKTLGEKLTWSGREWNQIHEQGPGSEVGFEPGFTEVKGRERNHWSHVSKLQQMLEKSLTDRFLENLHGKVENLGKKMLAILFKI